MSGQSAKKSMNHPDPEPIVNVQVWETGASVIWGLNELFNLTIHFTDAPKDPRPSSAR